MFLELDSCGILLPWLNSKFIALYGAIRRKSWDVSPDVVCFQTASRIYGSRLVGSNCRRIVRLTMASQASHYGELSCIISVTRLRSWWYGVRGSRTRACPPQPSWGMEKSTSTTACGEIPQIDNSRTVRRKWSPPVCRECGVSLSMKDGKDCGYH